jgi:hypothetical protein
MEIAAESHDSATTTPWLVREFTSPLDLSDFDELRFWFRSSQTANGSQDRPFYIAFEAAGAFTPGHLIWQRFLAVEKSNTWQLQRLWLADMPNDLREAVGAVRVRGVRPLGFQGAMDELIATTHEPVQDVEAAFLGRLHEQFLIDVAGTLTAVPAVVHLPEAPSTPDFPYILLTPWSVRLQRQLGSGSELIDNYTADGAHVRPTPQTLEFDYQIDVFAERRDEKTRLLDAILQSFAGDPFLIIGGEPFSVTPIGISSEESSRLIPPGRTPIFLRVVSPIESGVRVLRAQAVPFLAVTNRSQSGSDELIQI